VKRASGKLRRTALHLGMTDKKCCKDILEKLLQRIETS
jgi:hypothetical protein